MARAGHGHAGGDVEIHRAEDGDAAAARRRVGEAEVACDVVVRRVTCTAERPPRGGARAQRRPVRLFGLRHCIDSIPFVLCQRPLHYRAEQGTQK